MAIHRVAITNTRTYFTNREIDRDNNNINTTITLPPTWNPQRNLIACWAAGGSGGMGAAALDGSEYRKTSGGGGGSGAFFAAANVDIPAGTQFTVQLPARTRGFTSTNVIGTTQSNSTNGESIITFLRPSNLILQNTNLGIDIELESGGCGQSGWGDITNNGGVGGSPTRNLCPQAEYITTRFGSAGGRGVGDLSTTQSTAFQDWMSGGAGAGAPGPNGRGGSGADGWESDNFSSFNAFSSGGGAGNYPEDGQRGVNFALAGSSNGSSPNWATLGAQADRSTFRNNGFNGTGSEWGGTSLDPFIETNVWPFFDVPTGFERFRDFRSGMIANLSSNSVTSGYYSMPAPGGGGGGSSGNTGGDAGNFGAGGGGGGARGNGSSITYPGGLGGASGIFFIWETDDHTNFNFCM